MQNFYREYFLDFFKLENLQRVQIDHNSTCNLLCPQCARVENGKLNPRLPLKELNIEFYHKVFTPKLCSQLENILFCGNYGDVIASSNILDVCQYLKEGGVKSITIFTNGSLRTPKWWAQLAQILSDPKDKVCFSIDGLEDTNHLYRIGSQFHKIIENAQAFIKAGGKARWDYLVFRHNEHQIDQAIELAKQIGFSEIGFKKTNRFNRDKNYRQGESSSRDNVHLSRKGIKEYTLATPKKKQFQAEGVKDFSSIIEKYKSWENYIDQTPIRCKSVDLNNLFIDFNGKLWPCCWVGAPVYFGGEKNIQKNQLQQLIKRYGEDFNDLNKFSLEEVLSHIWYREELASSWQRKMKDHNCKLMTCGRTCGQEYEFSSNSAVNRQSIKLGIGRPEQERMAKAFRAGLNYAKSP